jgi:P-type Mg2+ transporter
MPDTNNYWSKEPAQVLEQLQTTKEGLSNDEAARRLKQYGLNSFSTQKQRSALKLFLSQFASPITIILILAATLSFFLQDPTDATIILVIVFLSSLLSFYHEYSAGNAVKKLLALVKLTTSIKRNGNFSEIPVEVVVPGDIVQLNAGDVIPGDCVIIDSNNLFADESVLTGESYPAEKQAGVADSNSGLSKRTNCLYMGTHVISGAATAVVVNTAKNTEFGKISQRLRLHPPETDFQIGIRKFGYMLMEVTLMLVIIIFVINVFDHKPVLDSFMFSLAIAVGLTPQLLPAIISVNLSYGAKHMAKQKVIVKRLESIENFGSMNVLCSDKTGTITDGTVKMKSALDILCKDSDKVMLYASINANFESGFINPIDEAIRQQKKPDLSIYQKTDELPYDFIRKRLSIVVKNNDGYLMVTKGALANVLQVSTQVEMPDSTVEDIQKHLGDIQNHFQQLSNDGYRVLGLSYKKSAQPIIGNKSAESAMVLCGFLVFYDPPKPGVQQTLQDLHKMGISFKVITGDNAAVAASVGKQVGMTDVKIITGTQLLQLSDEALFHQVSGVTIFAEVEPNQKERIIIALKKSGNVVGYMGDGINDASALHTADVGISVDTAVDVAKEAADIVLMEKDLNVLLKGVAEGRRTFINTRKYVFMATSANFGNMFSMAGASLFLPFLPLLPKQILFLNMLTDLPEMAIASDNVDAELVQTPRKWDIKFIRNFMIVFGILSSVFDYCTFWVLHLLHAKEAEFQTGWFIESVISATLVVLVIRTRKTIFQSRPGKYLAIATLGVVIFTFIMPLTPILQLLGFTKVPFLFILEMLGIVAAYIISTEIVKKIFYSFYPVELT